jgi:hypothetical protein
VSIDGGFEYENAHHFCQFFERHPNIESLDLTIRSRNDSDPHYIRRLKSFPKLKKLKFRDYAETLNGYFLLKVVDQYPRLKRFEILILEEDYQNAVEIIRRKFPRRRYRWDSRKIQTMKKVGCILSEEKKRGWDRLITIQKF